MDRSQLQLPQKVYFVWINRDRTAFEWFQDVLAGAPPVLDALGLLMFVSCVCMRCVSFRVCVSVCTRTNACDTLRRR